MELRINDLSIPEVIEFNYDEIKAEITEKVKTYKALVYSENEIKDAKKDRANLNKFVKALSDERIRIKKVMLQPYEDFEKKVKELTQIVQEPIDIIDAQVKGYEDKLKQEKADHIKDLYAGLEKPEWLSLDKIFDNKWLNASVTLANVEAEIKDRLQRVNSDIEILNNLTEYAFEAVEVYKSTLDTNKALNEAKRMVEIANAKAAKEAKAKEIEAAAQEKAAEELKHIEDQASKMREMAAEMAAGLEAGVKAPIDNSPKKWIKFAAEMSVEQAKALKAFFESNNINYKAI